jgi:hypothetical protein
MIFAMSDLHRDVVMQPVGRDTPADTTQDSAASCSWDGLGYEPRCGGVHDGKMTLPPGRARAAPRVRAVTRHIQSIEKDVALCAPTRSPLVDHRRGGLRHV